MSAIRIFSGVACNSGTILDGIKHGTGFQVVTDESIVVKAATYSDLTPQQIRRAFSSKASIFNNFTFEKERAIACLKLALTNHLNQSKCIFTGFSGLLIPDTIGHVLKVCLIADTKFRKNHLMEAKDLPEDEAIEAISKDDQDKSTWVHTLTGENDPWSPNLHDIIFPMDKSKADQALDLIIENLDNQAIIPTEQTRRAVKNFNLAARAELALLNAGHQVYIQAQEGNIQLGLHRQTLMHNRMQDELKQIVQNIDGVQSVNILTDPPKEKPLIYHKKNPTLPSKVLLVDDEREFVQTLSERLQMREMGSAVAYDGASALDLVETDEPEVMIIDLKMPEIDGIEVLKKVKQTRPEIQVVVLTGHGSEQDRQECMALGAFAYLQKPVDIDTLSETLKKAYEKTRTAGQ